MKYATATPKKNTYDNFCNRLAEKLYEWIKGNPLIWKRGWQKSNVCSPVNVGTGHRYSGGNSFCMALDCAINGNRPYFISQEPLNKILGLKPKTKGFINTKFIKNKSWLLAPQFKTVYDEVTKKPKLDKNGKEMKRLAYFKTFPVANLDEIIRKYPEHKEALEAHLLEKGYVQPKNENDNPIGLYNEHKEKLTTILDTLKCTFTEKGDRAYFSPMEQRVNMPEYGSFFEGAEWVGTFAHEVGHATKLDTSYTKNADRGGVRFGDQKYAQEELVAEFFSVLYCTQFGVAQNQENNVAYMQSWIKALGDLFEDDKKAFYQAVQVAQKNFENCMDKLGVEL